MRHSLTASAEIFDSRNFAISVSGKTNFVFRRDEIRMGIMSATYNAVLKPEGAEWIGWIEEIPEINARAKSQEAVYDLLRENLAVALANSEAAEQHAEDELTDSLATDYIITRDFL